ncbi:TIGR04211 family SH3 domain-containing protein [Solimonas sp. K1W22B-7]|uniref:TIGR04211 family SH3 domain-containing protein n=1 Tax=Solimonas sp. K1W22B-7 TaxID=2303331 RepID=UPI000E3360A6|nr:TIGR04211 family SH3 domain-containing protein [Solimonas sp. K1W22B-7]AXQ31553.1 TIGR04211 family SH3 domain-containing protein [Solimonas sp. K1W22B-7]
MTRTLLLVSVLLAPTLAFAQSAGRQQYISDDITVTLREQPRNDAAPAGALKSGAKVSVLESLGPESFTRIRTADGREGWVTSRFLSSQPAAKERYLQAQQSLDEAQKRAANLERELTAAQQQLGLAKPAFELARENEALKASIASLQQDNGAIQQRYDVERAKRRTLIAGASLVGVGVLLGLLLPWIGGGRKKRRYGDF